MTFFLLSVCHQVFGQQQGATLVLPSQSLAGPAKNLKIDGFFYSTPAGRTTLPLSLSTAARGPGSKESSREAKMPDGRVVRITITPQAGNFIIRLSADRDTDIIKWGLAIDSRSSEYYTGLMERVVDGRQAASWEPGIKEAMNLRGQKVDMIIKPTTSIYAPFYLSSRGYAVFIKGDWPGYFDFAVDNPERVRIEFEGPSIELKIYTAADPASLVRQHALDAGPPFIPPKWMFLPCAGATSTLSEQSTTTARR